MHSTLLQNEMKREKKCALLLIKTLNSKLLLKRRELWSMYCTYFLPSFLPSPKVIAIDSENVPHFSVQFFFFQERKKNTIFMLVEHAMSKVLRLFPIFLVLACISGVVFWIGLSQNTNYNKNLVYCCCLCVWSNSRANHEQKKNGLKNLK